MDCRREFVIGAAWALLAAVGLAGIGLADDAARKADEQAIRQAATDYIAALERGDTKALEAVWTADGDIIDEYGHAMPAREVIAAGANAEHAASRPKVTLLASTIRFVNDTVALEDGTSEVTRGELKDLPPAQGRFTAVWVKQDGKWRLASLREVRLGHASAADDLAELNWMVGDWSGEAGPGKFEVSTRWNSKHTFLIRELTIYHEGQEVLNASQRIGWDPKSGSIRSWIFDSDGGHGVGQWIRHGETWIVQAQGVLANGRQTASTNIYTRTGPNTMSWKSTGGVSGGQESPDFEIQLTRTPAEKK
jgi:uncharacterized protein (TIGR02246 family)